MLTSMPSPRRALMVGALLLLVLALSPATADHIVSGKGMSLVATLPYDEGTHMEFMVREIDGVRRTFAVTGARNQRTASNGGLRIIDVTDPTTPTLTGSVSCPQSANDVPVSYDGQVVLLTSDSGGCRIPSPRPGWRSALRDMGIVDTSNPAAPVLLGSPSNFPSMGGVHSAVFHPRRRVAYLSTQVTPQRQPRLFILDVTDINAPTVTSVVVPETGSAPHDITFNADGTRAYVSAVTASYILDTSGPKLFAPTLVAMIADPTINIHHEAFIAPNGRHLFIVDEVAGALANPVCPAGGVHVYDLGADERAPIPVGFFTVSEGPRVAEEPRAGELAACTSHEGNFSPDGSLFSIGWFANGARVFDVSSLSQNLPPGTPVSALIREVAYARVHPASDAWAAKFAPGIPGYVFTHDTGRGLDVLRLDSGS